jgi:hypothetical protein
MKVERADATQWRENVGPISDEGVPTRMRAPRLPQAT